MRHNRASRGRRNWGHRGPRTGTLEWSLGDFGEQVLHVLVSVLKIHYSLFNGGDQRLFAVSRRLGMHAVPFSSVGRKKRMIEKLENLHGEE